MSLAANATVAASQRAPGQRPSLATTPTAPHPRSISRTSSNEASGKGQSASQAPVRGATPQKSSRRPRTPAVQEPSEPDDAKWGSNFWVTLVDPQSQTSFFACPATGQVSWDAPVGNFVLPPSEDGEWWELSDESRGGIPYYYQTKTGETVWERPSGFVIPLGIIQHTALGKRLSVVDRTSKISFYEAPRQDDVHQKGTLQLPSSNRPPSSQSMRRSGSDHRPNSRALLTVGTHLDPIPGSPYATEQSEPPSPASSSTLSIRSGTSSSKQKDKHGSKICPSEIRGKATSVAYAQQPQSLDAALEQLEQLSTSQSEKDKRPPTSPTSQTNGAHYLSSESTNDEFYPPSDNSPPASPQGKSRESPTLQARPVPIPPAATVGGKIISSPIINHAATLEMNPVKNRNAGKPIAVFVDPKLHTHSPPSLNSISRHPTFPDALVSDIQLFSQSEYARQYFSTHRSGFIFKRRIPVEQLMTWQKAPLTSPLLMLNRTLHKNAVRIFKALQYIMGDREKERPTGVRSTSEGTGLSSSFGPSSVNLSNSNAPILEEQRWVLTEGLLHGELRDETYCQLMKQLTGNPSTESTFKGWQFLCVLLFTFPPSKDFETFLEAFIQKHTSHSQGRIDVIAKYCLGRLSAISRKGPRGKPPLIAEIETAADAAFNPSTFGESLDAIIRLQERNYPHQKVPIILPFLADGILALGGTRAEGIFRVPGDNDSVSELKLRIDRGYYTLDTVDDPHVLAALMKLWLRELCDPVVPSEMYNECIMSANDPAACISIVHRLPTINRRVVLFVVSFLQIFLDEKTQSVTKMTPANLALVMAPNLLRCDSDSLSVVFTNAQYEQIFVYHLLLHLKCDEVDAGYKPVHGLAASKQPKHRARRPT